MGEYIDREALLDKFRPYEDDLDGIAATYVIGEIEDFPAADVAPVVHGRWIVTKGYNDVIDMDVAKYTCSACGEYRLSATTLSQATNYCPNCGARMDGE